MTVKVEINIDETHWENECNSLPVQNGSNEVRQYQLMREGGGMERSRGGYVRGGEVMEKGLI